MTTYQLTHEGYVIKDGDTKVPTAKVQGIDPHPETLAYEAWIEAGGVPLPADQIPLEAQISAFDAALGAHLDATAQQRRYTDRYTCALRAGYPGPFQPEGIAFAQWMDSANAMGYQLLGEVLSGQRPMPEDPQEFIALLPAMEWPT